MTGKTGATGPSGPTGASGASGTILVGGAFPDSIGCIPCDGASRWMSFDYQYGVHFAYNATVTSWALPVPDGTVTNFRVVLTAPTSTLNGYGLYTVAPGDTTGSTLSQLLGCTVPLGGTSCEDTGSASIAPGLALLVGVGNAGVYIPDHNDVPSFSVQFTPGS